MRASPSLASESRASAKSLTLYPVPSTMTGNSESSTSNDETSKVVLVVTRCFLMRLRSMPLGGTAKVNSNIAERTDRVSKERGDEDAGT